MLKIQKLLAVYFFVFAVSCSQNSRQTIQYAFPSEFVEHSNINRLGASQSSFQLKLQYTPYFVRNNLGKWVSPVLDNWEIDKENKSFKFCIKKDLKWSNSTPITIDEVLSDLENKKTYFSNVMISFSGLKDSIKKSQSNLCGELRFDYPPNEIMGELAMLPASLFPPEVYSYGVHFNKKEVRGSGPYRLSNYTKGELKFELNSHYGDSGILNELLPSVSFVNGEGLKEINFDYYRSQSLLSDAIGTRLLNMSKIDSPGGRRYFGLVRWSGMNQKMFHAYSETILCSLETKGQELDHMVNYFPKTLCGTKTQKKRIPKVVHLVGSSGFESTQAYAEIVRVLKSVFPQTVPVFHSQDLSVKKMIDSEPVFRIASMATDMHHPLHSWIYMFYFYSNESDSKIVGRFKEIYKSDHSEAEKVKKLYDYFVSDNFFIPVHEEINSIYYRSDLKVDYAGLFPITLPGF